MATAPLKCPVCGAKVRGERTCSRCTSDLTPMLRIAARAFAARQRSRAALLAGDLPEAMHWSVVARRLQG
ncbi:MAG TPA: hypothetical protein VFE47_26260 [Tepidisphaeraceae bacterium]|jgi:hypothetical protein|nr:hypothetical protein [Tepidisphaeraceae bacterium]